MSETETANVLNQVVNGLLYLKKHNILHRDLSLSNLLLTKDLRVKIADFGLATQLSRFDEKHLTLCGTPNYISPEVASRASQGLPVDVWGLGCMMYTLLVGRPPFDTDGIKSTLTKVVMSDFTLPSYLSMEAKDLLDRLLRKNPSDRIPIDQVLGHPFMTKFLDTSRCNSRTMTSMDSGLMTMSSEAMSTPNLTGRSGSNLPRSQSEDPYNYSNGQQANQNVFQKYNTPTACSSMYNKSTYSDQQYGYQNQYHEAEPGCAVKRFGSIEMQPSPPESLVFGQPRLNGFGMEATGNKIDDFRKLNLGSGENCNRIADPGGGLFRQVPHSNGYSENQENHHHHNFVSIFSPLNDFVKLTLNCLF